MAWESSNRAERLPANWSTLRMKVHRRDRSRCQVRMPSGQLCLEIAIDVDHIRAGDDHDLSNLRCICDWHHKQKSSSEGWQARAKKIAVARKKFRRDEKHPGEL